MLLETLEMHQVPILMSERQHLTLLSEAEEYGVTERELARVAFEVGLKMLRHKRKDADMKAFVAEFAGTEWDFDPEVAAAGVEVILVEPSGFEEFIPEHLKRELNETR
jgi:hypothetical protein